MRPTIELKVDSCITQLSLEAISEAAPAGPLDLTSAITAMRARAYEIRVSTQAFDFSTFGNHAFDFLAWLQEEQNIEGLNKPNVFEWWSEFQHRHLIMITLLAVSSRSQSSRQEMRDFAVYTLRRLKRFLLDVVHKTHPNIAAKLISSLIPEGLVSDPSRPLFPTLQG